MTKYYANFQNNADSCLNNLLSTEKNNYFLIIAVYESILNIFALIFFTSLSFSQLDKILFNINYNEQIDNFAKKPLKNVNNIL